MRLSLPRTFSSQLMLFSHIIIENYFYHIFKYFIGTDTLALLSFAIWKSIHWGRNRDPSHPESSNKSPSAAEISLQRR